eukprot:TRINITY_DN44613_c0_g1_i1.p1 TRINITY_DN44613_c0_g1~~TRINITY_DN44613_c0_g1_i1.p1  ORF type:complete len:289 (+),score=94.45 TRINITY_DN44613_c0_g1_i1:180-1046(+)
MRYKLHRSDVDTLQQRGVVTMSAGNAGKAVSYLGQAAGCDVKVFMPETSPEERKAVMEGYGATVVKVPGVELLQSVAACIHEEQRVLVHPFDDCDLIRGHGSCGLEILEDVPNPDVVLVCCGGGGLLAGVAAAVQSGSPADQAPLVVGVEPEGAPSMALSMQAGSQQWCQGGGKTRTIAHGLAPPFAGKACFRHVQEFVDDMVLCSDQELRQATKALFVEAGVVSEVSGAAALAAVLSGRVDELLAEPKAKKAAGEPLVVVCVISGRNIEVQELAQVMDLEHPMDEHQ